MMKTNGPTRDIIYRLGGKKSQFPATLKLRITHTQNYSNVKFPSALDSKPEETFVPRMCGLMLALNNGEGREMWKQESQANSGMFFHTQEEVFVPANECSNCHSLIQLS